MTTMRQCALFGAGVTLVLGALAAATASEYDRDVLRDAGPEELNQYATKDKCVEFIDAIYLSRDHHERMTEEMGMSREYARQALYDGLSADPETAAEHGVPADVIYVHVVDGIMDGKSNAELRNEVVDLCDEHLDPPIVHDN